MTDDYVRLDFVGKPYPTQEQARTRMRKTLEILKVPFLESDIIGVMEASGRWSAFVRVRKEDWDSRQRGAIP